MTESKLRKEAGNSSAFHFDSTSEATNVLVAGVGGQGVILATYVLSQVALEEAYDVKQNDVVGMSQRGGSVVSHLRFGQNVHSPLVAPGTADLLLSFEALEALRYQHWLKAEGRLVYNIARINPATVAGGFAEYPVDVPEQIRKLRQNVVPVDGTALASRAGNRRAANVALLGAVSVFLPFGEEAWKAVIKQVVPSKTIDANLAAFQLGREAVNRANV
ncbi:MAG: indolepyruvate oxidoreductase subunit beta [Thermoleophilia bacterium]